MTPWLSNKFKWLSLVATWAVVCIHSRTDRWVPNASDWANTLQRSVSPMFNFAVPLFFGVSGFMFVSSYRKYGWRRLMKQKLKSLYLPAVIWIVVGMLLCLPIRLYSGGGVPDVWRFVGALILWVEGCDGQHFWYVRSLLIVFAIAPVAFAIAQRCWLALPLVLLSALVACPIANSGCFNLRLNTTVIFFMTGAFIASNSKLSNFICMRNERSGSIMAIGGLMLCMSPYLHLAILGQMMLLWGLYDVIDAHVKIQPMPSSFNVLFFIYCIHLIVICWIGGGLKLALGITPFARTVSYIALCMTFWLDVLIANLMLRYFPRLYAVLSGGRVK